MTEPQTRRRFSPRLVPTVIGLIMLVILVMLGNWQRDRYYEKLQTLADYARQHDELPAVTNLASVKGDGRDVQRLKTLQHRRGELTGTLEPDKAQLLTARYMFGQRGYGVMMPLLQEGARYDRILVHMGWVPAEKIAAYLREVAAAPKKTVKGRLQVSGSAENARPSGELLGHPTWVRVHADAIAKRVDGLEPRLMLQAGEMAVGMPIRTDKYPISGYAHPVRMMPSKHVEYAATWYGLALTLICVWLALSFRKVPVAPVPADS